MGTKLAESKEDKELLDLIIDGMQDKKANNIVKIDMYKSENTLTDYILICDAESTTQVSAIADNVEYNVKKNIKTYPHSVEGKGVDSWILIDYGYILVHIFKTEIRPFYDLEGLWADVPIKEIQNN